MDEEGARTEGDPNADPTNLTVDRYYQSYGAMFGITLHRRPLEWAQAPGVQRCECGGPATLYSTDLLATTGKMVLLCDPCWQRVVRLTQENRAAAEAARAGDGGASGDRGEG